MGEMAEKMMSMTPEQAAKRMISKATYKSFETESEAALEVVNGKACYYVDCVR